ncbi:MAG: hypothetical protein AAGG75_05275 [Bacteroidota bacterium]
MAKYIEGNFSEGELEQISEHLINAKLDRDRRREWATELETHYGVHPDQAPSPRRTWLPYALVAALLLLGALLCYYWLTSSSSSYQLATDQHIRELSIMGDQSVLRKGPQGISELRSEASLHYARRQYEQGIPLFEQLLASPASQASDYFYLALCHLQKTNAEAAKTIPLLLQARALGGPAEETAWVLSLAYLKTGALPEARQELQGIVDRKGYKAREAEALLRLF